MENVEQIINDFTVRLFDYEKVIENIKVNDSELGLNGLPSIIVFLSEYGLSDKIKDKYDVSNLLRKYVELLVDSLNREKKINQTLSVGVTGILYSLSILDNYDENYGDLIIKIKKIFLSITTKYIEKLNSMGTNQLKEEYYDFINGLSGNLSVLLSYYPDDTKHIFLILEYFIKLFKSCDKNIFSLNIDKENIPTIYVKNFYPQGYINLSTAHGVAFPLFLLTKAWDMGFEIHGLKETIDSLFNIYWRFCIKKCDLYYFPGRISLSQNLDEIDIKKWRNSWCYGDVSIKSILYYVSVKLDKKEYINRLKNSILKSVNDDIEYLNFSSPTFCHGYSGFLSMIEYINNLDTELDFSKLKEQLTNKILSFYNFNYDYCFKDYDYEYNNDNGCLSSDVKPYDRLGILSGSIGVMLVLLSRYDSKATNWQKIFFG